MIKCISLSVEKILLIIPKNVTFVKRNYNLTSHGSFSMIICTVVTVVDLRL